MNAAFGLRPPPVFFRPLEAFFAVLRVVAFFAVFFFAVFALFAMLSSAP
jgi:hypothetical protein